MKTCKYCKKIYIGTNKETCSGCYSKIRVHGKINPDAWNKKCVSCSHEFISKTYNIKWCKDCAYKFRLNRNLKKYREKRNINPDSAVKFKKKDGEGHISKKGYVYLTKIGHPNAKSKGRILEHIFLMSNHLNRPLIKGENVHHKNGIRHDNRIENLELWSSSQPPGQRIEDKIKWCKEFLKQYDV